MAIPAARVAVRIIVCSVLFSFTTFLVSLNILGLYLSGMVKLSPFL